MTRFRRGARRPRRNQAAGAAAFSAEPRYLRRRRIAGLAAVLLGVAVLGVGTRILLYDATVLDVREVRVTGTVVLAEQDVRAAAAVPVGVALARVDTAAVAERVAELTDVAAVDVGRSWPHTVTVEVTERVPVVVAVTARGDFLVDTTGLPYRETGSEPGLPRLVLDTVAPGDAATMAALAVVTGLPEDLRAQVLDVRVEGGAVPQVVLDLSGGRQVRWGSAERVAEKAAVLAALLSRPGHVYDVASPELPTIRP